MAIHPDAGRPVAKENLIDVAELISCYYQSTPDISNPDEKVAFGTSGHRGTSLKSSFNEDHIIAIAQAICVRIHTPFPSRPKRRHFRFLRPMVSL